MNETGTFKKGVGMQSRLAVMLIALMMFFAQQVHAQNNWFMTVYGGQNTGGSIDDFITFDNDFRDSYLFAVTGEKNLHTWCDLIRLEAEGQVVKHFGIQENWEFNGLLTLRWLKFPWDRYLDTSFAAGDGLSYATEVPVIERQRHGEESARFLNYLMFEFTFGLPKYPRWSLITRLHHRSGVFGLFDGVHGGSNYLCFGLRYDFL